MSPRSEEFIDSARERLARSRAALSEGDAYAKTHSGTWTLFSERFVATGAFDQDIYKFAGRAQEARQEGDYEAASLSLDLSRELLDAAGRFVAAVERMLAPE